MHLCVWSVQRHGSDWYNIFRERDMMWIVKLIVFLILSYLLIIWISRKLVFLLFTEVDLTRYHSQAAPEAHKENSKEHE